MENSRGCTLTLRREWSRGSSQVAFWGGHWQTSANLDTQQGRMMKLIIDCGYRATCQKPDGSWKLMEIGLVDQARATV
ncbi:hypothetical protein VTJ04DRAFT_2179 [Mycothermus thermophilus]|uniref:uncharacterized protein n=1 Tax=Humicola insolens TaxID=85995 RepID=UPI003742238D